LKVRKDILAPFTRESSMKVLVCYGDTVIARIQSILGSEATIIQSWNTAESMIEKGLDADVVISNRVPAEYIQAASNLKMIQTLGTGVNSVDLDAVRAHGNIVVCNTHVNAIEVAEYAIMLLLAAAKQIIVSDRTFRQGDWQHGWGGPRVNIELYNKTCLLIGLGNIGTEIAKRLKGFEMKILAATKSGVARESGLVNAITSIESVRSFVQESDFVILSLPLTKESTGLVDEEFLSWMKPTAILVNISRGRIIEEGSLYHALKKKQILGAALDVWWDFPKSFGNTKEQGGPSDKYPFHELDNVVLSPHRAGYSNSVLQNVISFAGQNVLKFIRGEKPQNMIDLQFGY
jgi:lactate dehydrogenase-like 2-hydroxyacid dehydrogenase